MPALANIKFILFLPIIFIFGCSSLTPSPEFAKWASIKSPSSGESRVFGAYQAGCLGGAKPLPLQGEGYYVVRRSRERYYGHPTLINYVTSLGKQLNQKKLPLMIVEDLSFPRGGPFLNGHNSHQIGLDIDISLKLVKDPPTEEQSEKWVSPTYVENRKTLLPSWGPEQIQLSEAAAGYPEVNRIFVAPAIKKYFCENYKEAPWLYKIRSWWGHDDHLHVRLNCPTDSPECKPQTALDPSNNGCGTELEWWYSAEADAEAAVKEQEPPSVRKFPDLPTECDKVKNEL